MAVLSILHPLAAVGQIFGLSYIYSNNKIITLILISYSIIFSMSHAYIMIYSYLLDNNRIVYFKIQSSLNVKAQIRQVSKLFQTYQNHIESIIFSIFPIINYKNIMKLRKIINDLEKTLNSMDYKLNSKFVAIKLNVIISTYVMMCAFTIIVNYTVSEDQSWIYVIYRVSHLLVLPLALAQCGGYILICTEILKALNNLTKNGTSRIKTIVTLYDIVGCNICKMINRIYGFQLLIFFLLTFQAILTEVYDHFLLNASLNSLDRCFGIVWLIWNLIGVVTLILTIEKFQVNLARFGSLFHHWELNHNYKVKRLTGKIVSKSFSLAKILRPLLPVIHDEILLEGETDIQSLSGIRPMQSKFKIVSLGILTKNDSRPA